MLLNELFEGEGKHITFCFGRMNPPTIGHEQVFKTMASVGGDYKIFVSQTQDKKENPLDYSTKTKFIKLIHPSYADNLVVDPSLNTVMKVASYLYELGYRNATFVAGSDRLQSFQKLIGDYNGVEGKGHGYYKFEVLDFKSSGERDPDSPGVSGVSASKAREKAIAGDLKGFEEATGAGQYAKELYNAVRKGMGVKEDDVEEGAKVDRQAKHITASMMKKGKSRKDAEAIAWAHIKHPKKEDIAEAPIEMDPSEPMNPMIHSHDKANPAKLKYRMLRAAGQLKDLAARAENASPSEWQIMARQFEELKMNMEQIRHALEELGKVKSKGGIKSRGITV